MEFLGESVEFWLELKRRTDLENTTKLYRELAVLRAQNSFIKSRLEEINEFLGASESEDG